MAKLRNFRESNARDVSKKIPGLWFDLTVEPGLIQLRTKPKRRNDDALHGDS
jgi:hypothetical protein